MQMLTTALAQAGLFAGIAWAGVMVPRDSPTYTMNPLIAQWDSSCGLSNPANHAETRQDAVVRAWVGALELAADAWDRWSDVKPFLKELAPESHPNAGIELKANQADAAYTQFFAMSFEKETINKVEDVLKKMNTLTNVMPGKGGRPDIEMYISCNDESVGNMKCDKDLVFEVDLPDKKGSLLNFCTGFWEEPRFDVWKKAALNAKHSGNGGPGDVTQKDWERVRNIERWNAGTEAGTLFKQLTHIDWIGNTNPYDKDGKANPTEIQGWWNNAQHATNTVHGKTTMKEVYLNAESYSWYAQYGYFLRRLTPRSNPWPLAGPKMAPNSIAI
ncbi:uncharacterized protein N7511_003654 [Penicillium nucicola]|uniref:uncharacterized protein n=1 Tax=Penicillium nucicola TaxID=1850975 RepID=UPI00254598C5|nr:uncharacterized protein N7511_003654 [Penicillium nucicola]KAJ5766038.1 hypothetical protein N7511_003654 [Penicillium nucicola]